MYLYVTLMNDKTFFACFLQFFSEIKFNCDKENVNFK